LHPTIQVDDLALSAFGGKVTITNPVEDELRLSAWNCDELGFEVDLVNVSHVRAGSLLCDKEAV